MNSRSLLGLLPFLLPIFLWSQTSAPRAVARMSLDSLDVMNDHFHQLVDEGRLAGIQTAIVRHDKLVQFDSYGFSDIAGEKTLGKNDIFRIFSMTKPIVSVALMQLYEQGKFALDDPLHKFIPAFENVMVYTDSMLIPAQRPIRIIDLLRHSSGYSYGRSSYPELDAYYREANLYAASNNAEYVQKLCQIPLEFEPGTGWRYGVSTNICGHLVEVLSGQPLDQYLRQHILDPLHMYDTHFQVPPEKVDRFTVGYGWEEEEGLTIVQSASDNNYVRKVTLFNGGGGLVSTTFDYLKFCQMLLHQGTLDGVKILAPATVELMLQDHLGTVREHQSDIPLPAGEAGFGLGFAVRGTAPDSLQAIYGWGGAVGTYFKIDLEHDLAYVMMIQLSPYRQLGLRELFHNYVQGAVLD